MRPYRVFFLRLKLFVPTLITRCETLKALGMLLLALGLGVACSARAAEGDQYALCGPGFAIPALPSMPDPSPIIGAIDIESDDAQLKDSGLSILRGNVVVHRGTTFLSSDEVHYTQEGEREAIDARGSVQLWDQGLYLTGTRGQMEVSDELTIVENSNFHFLDAHAHGTAARVQLSGNDLVKANDATYSTCNPGNEDWFLEAERLRLDKTKDEGTGRNVWVTFKGVPIFFSPFLTFPLSDARKSGFLAPSVGVSNSAGFDATVPYYFNIAPNMDATLGLRTMSERGVQLQGEFRYLFGWGEGSLSSEIMAHDQQTDEPRGAVSFEHFNLSPNQRWRTDLAFNWVSDREYFEDLGTSLTTSSQTFLEQSGSLSYSGDNFYLLTRAQRFQTVDSRLPGTSRPYERLPQIFLTTALQERNLRINANTTAEIVNFHRADSVTGLRWDLRPSINFPYRTASAFIVPKAVLRYTGYALSGRQVGVNESPSRLVPTFSLDSGLFFDREMSFGSRQITQTLEPRLFYLFTPFNRQDDLPVFDTGEFTFSFAQLFREDRFSGADRVSDAHQVSAALTTRFLDRNSGAELGRASIGQIRFLRNRRVNLPGRSRQTARGSDLAAELVANLDQRWRVSAGALWDLDTNRTTRNTVAVRYRPDERRVLNLSYRFVRDAIEQTDASIAWPVARNWRAVGRWNFSLQNRRTVETFSGFEYDNCCWGLRLVGRRYLSSSNGEYTSGVFIQFVLKGLTSVGDADALLGRSIPGYRDEF
ncbi:MAG: LPS-assembly protein [Gammaproteobacteria bacterium]|jgi:LPS-assembly protein